MNGKKIGIAFLAIEALCAFGSLVVNVVETVKGKKMTEDDKVSLARLIVDEQEARKAKKKAKKAESEQLEG